MKPRGKQAARGRPSTGRVECRANGKFRARITLEGKRHCATFKTLAEAELWVIDLEQRAAAGRLEPHLRAQAVTLAEGMQRMLESMSESGYTKDTDKKISHLIESEPDLCKRKLATLTRDDFKSFIRRRAGKGAKAATINRDLSIMRKVFYCAIDDWNFDGLTNPLLRLSAGKEAERDRRPSPMEEQALARAIAQYLASPTTKSRVPILQLIEFTSSTGLRLIELGNLRWGDVIWAKSSVWVQRGKGGKKRLVPMFPSIVKLLHVMGGGPPDALIFGKRDAIKKTWQAVRNLAAKECPSIKPGNDQNLRLHDLRHEAISRLFERTDLADGAIAAISGHSDGRSLYRYKNIRNADLAPRLADAEKKHEESCHNYAVENPDNGLSHDIAMAAELRAAWRVTSSSKEALTRLVERLPYTQIAELYGVSDVAVHKACKRHNIVKPQRNKPARKGEIANQGGANHTSL